MDSVEEHFGNPTLEEEAPQEDHYPKDDNEHN